MGRRTIILEASDNDRVAAASEELTPQAYHDFCRHHDIKPDPMRYPMYDPQVVSEMLRDLEVYFRSLELEVKNGNSFYLPPREIHYAINELCKYGLRDEVNRIVKRYLGNLAPDIGILQWIADNHLKETEPHAEPRYPANHRRHETRADARSIHFGRF